MYQDPGITNYNL